MRLLRLRVAAVLIAAMPLVTSGARAQATPYVPLDDPAYAFIDALVTRGALPGLPLLARPYTAETIERAISRTPTAAAESHALLIEALRRRLSRYDADQATEETPAEHRLRVVTALEPRLTAQTSTRRELMLANGDGGVHPGISGRAHVAVGHLAAGARLSADGRLRVDPEFAGHQDGPIAGRVDDAYIAGQWRYGELFLGRTARNWGPPGGTGGGLQIGAYAYSYDHLYGRLGTDRLHIATVLARLDDTPGLFVPRSQRYLSVHRLAGMWRSLELALTETYVYAGEGRGFEPTLMNPFVPFLITHYNDTLTGNVSFAAEGTWRSPIGVLGAQVLVDDFQFERGNLGDDEPASYGMTLSADGIPLFGAHRAFASYARLSSLLYRTPEFAENYVSRGVALGHGFTDYDELRAGVELLLPLPLIARAYGAYRRQGAGDYRAPFPPPEEYATTPGFLIGSVGRTLRVGVHVTGEAWRGILIDADVGVNDVREAGGAYGPVHSGLVGRVLLRFEPAALRRVISLD